MEQNLKQVPWVEISGRSKDEQLCSVHRMESPEASGSTATSMPPKPSGRWVPVSLGLREEVSMSWGISWWQGEEWGQSVRTGHKLSSYQVSACSKLLLRVHDSSQEQAKMGIVSGSIS